MINIYNIKKSNDTSLSVEKYLPTDQCSVEVDYLGNIFLVHNDVYYYVTIDPADKHNNVTLNIIKNVEYYRNNLKENEHLEKHFKSGIIRSGKGTLCGKVYDSIHNMNEEELQEYIMYNEYGTCDLNFIEKKYYWTQYENIDEQLEDDSNIEFYLNGVIKREESNKNGIFISELLMSAENSFDTILIHGNKTSKKVLSTIERIDNYCSIRLTIYTDGIFRINFIDSVVYYRLCVDEHNKLHAIYID